MNINRQVILGALGAILFFYLMWRAPIVPLAIGVLALFGLLQWLEQAWGVPQGWGKWIGAAIIALTITVQGWQWYTERFPIVGEAAGRRTNYAAMTMADIFDPRYPTRLSQFLTDAKRLRIAIEEQRCINQLSESMQNMAALQPHQPFRQDDDSVIAACSRRFERLRKQLADTQYAESIAGRIAEKTLSTKFLAFGALLGLLAIGLAIPTPTRTTAKWIGGIATLSILIGGAILFFGADIARAVADSESGRGATRSINGPPPLPFNRKATETRVRPDSCTEVWMAGNEEEGVPVGTLAPGQTARVRFLGGRIVINPKGEAWPHWGLDYYAPEWKTSFRYHNREDVRGRAILGVLGDVASPTGLGAFAKNRNEFELRNNEPDPQQLQLYYHGMLQFYDQNGWEGSRAHLEVCVLSTTARLNGTP